MNDLLLQFSTQTEQKNEVNTHHTRHSRVVCRYKDEQTELLEEEAKLDEPETIHFFKTLITCEKLT